MDNKRCAFTFASGRILAFKYAEGSNLPIAIATQKAEVSKDRFAGKAYALSVSSGKLNLSKAQEELLLWY